ncbi:nucleoside 2-deoxyribosyltransferase domain-containing protein [Allocatelliglobosispora scoriae]|nr:nucleoside 2-deoxyribosyltransferase domain-containing protein [Allocatelliglobosispora scoriae]
MVVVHAGEEPPGTWQASMFLAGPMPRDPDIPSWRPDALDSLRAAWTAPGALVVFVPEARDRHNPTPGYVSQLWEERWMAVVDVMLFWVPRDMTTLPGLNTNLEFGRNEATGRIVLGVPPHAVSVHYLRRAAETHGAPVRESLHDTVLAALSLVGEGASRSGPDRDVPLLIWRTEAFQKWRRAVTGELAGARLLWAWSPGPSFRLQMWALRADVVRPDVLTSEVVTCHPGAHEVLISPIP